MINFLQGIALVFALSMIYFASLNFKRKEINFSEYFWWLIIWISAIITIVLPDLLRQFSETFLFTRLFDMIVVLGFVVVIIIVTRAYIKVRKVEKNIEKLLRDEAIKKAKRY